MVVTRGDVTMTLRDLEHEHRQRSVHTARRQRLGSLGASTTTTRGVSSPFSRAEIHVRTMQRWNDPTATGPIGVFLVDDDLLVLEDVRAPIDRRGLS